MDRRWPPDPQALLLVAAGVFLAGVIALGLRAELGPVDEWGCAWRVRRGQVSAPDLRGHRLGDARGVARALEPCVSVRLVGDGAAAGADPVVAHQSPAPGEDLDRPLIDVVAAER